MIKRIIKKCIMRNPLDDDVIASLFKMVLIRPMLGVKHSVHFRVQLHDKEQF